MKENKPRNEWICLSEKSVFDTPVVRIFERQCKSSEDERLYKFFLLKSRDWCNIIPVTEDGKVVMVKQYRIGSSQHTIEMPGGVVDATDLNLRDAAIREMTEETGYVPLPGAQCVDLCKFSPNPAILDNQVHGFIVGPVRLEKPQKLDVGEMIEVVEVPIDDIPEMILKGEISHSLMLTTLLYVALSNKEGSNALRSGLRRFTTLAGS